MAGSSPVIVAGTMGFHRGGRSWSPGPVLDLAFHLASQTDTPRLCLLTTGTGDSSESIAGFYGAFAGSTVCASHVGLFPMPNVSDVGTHLREQDVIWVDRGSLVNLIAVWQAHGLDRVLRECWQAGIVLAGESAGALCWYAAGSTDSFGPRLAVASGLGLLPYGAAVHYAQRRRHFEEQMRAGRLPPVGHASDVGAALVYRGVELVEAVADRSGAGAYRVELRGGDEVVETPLPVRRLG